jgi:RNA polymerase sigma-70 factor (ECF subfamily)
MDGLKGEKQTASDRDPREIESEDDVRLMLLVKQGDADAFNALMQKYQRTVVNLAYRFTGDADAAQDLAQEVFLRIYQAAGRFEAKAKFFTYLYTVTINLCRNARDKLQRRKTYSLNVNPFEEDGPARDLPDPAGSAADQLDRKELSEIVQQAILSLPEEQRELVVLQRYQGLGYEEIAEVTGQSVPAIKSKLHRAKLGLKKRLESHLEL